ncbi:hypothetical protein APT15_12030 [Escherichia coli]|nr:hypothetical protein APT15_12030 [Escherichia coli]
MHGNILISIAWWICVSGMDVYQNLLCSSVWSFTEEATVCNSCPVTVFIRFSTLSGHCKFQMCGSVFFVNRTQCIFTRSSASRITESFFSDLYHSCSSDKEIFSLSGQQGRCHLFSFLMFGKREAKIYTTGVCNDSYC